jgi:hypothetical protein
MLRWTKQVKTECEQIGIAVLILHVILLLGQILFCLEEKEKADLMFLS